MTGVMALCAVSAFTVLLIGRKIICEKIKMQDMKEETVEMIVTS